jgi:hypothetical protein
MTMERAASVPFPKPRSIDADLDLRSRTEPPGCAGARARIVTDRLGSRCAELGAKDAAPATVDGWVPVSGRSPRASIVTWDGAPFRRSGGRIDRKSSAIDSGRDGFASRWRSERVRKAGRVRVRHGAHPVGLPGPRQREIT